MNEENSIKEEYTPKLFSDDQTKKETSLREHKKKIFQTNFLIKT